MAHYTGDRPYTGDEKIMIAIDIGSTHRDRPVVRMVHKWPGQREAVGDCKIPTIVAYQNGVAEAFGAEAREFIGDNDYEVARWFKLHLHPASMRIDPPSYSASVSQGGGLNNSRNPESALSSALSDLWLDGNSRPNVTSQTKEKLETAEAMEIPPLPSNVTLVQVYTEFLKYLLETTREFFQTTILNGINVWRRLEDKSIDIILTIPNGWDTPQQVFLRDAVMKTGFLKNIPRMNRIGMGRYGHDNYDLDDSRIDFVTEGEASVHYALAHSQSSSWLRKGTMFAVTDAGGSTVDSTLYECKSLEPSLVLEEVCASECVQAGGVFVDRAARTMLQAKLKNSKFGDEEFVELMVDEFEKKTKRIFDGQQSSNVIHFGRNSDNDRAVDIMKGRISLTPNDVSSTFDRVTARIVDSCLRLLNGRRIEFLLLVGGFGESPYLRKRLSNLFRPKGADVVSVEEPSKKAAAEGAAIWYLKRLVVARAARFTIGTSAEEVFNRSLPHHREREHLTYIAIDDTRRVTNCFNSWVEKNQVIPQYEPISFCYTLTYNEIPEDLGSTSQAVYAWEGPGHVHFVKDIRGRLIPNMRKICEIKADLSGLRDGLKVHFNSAGEEYWEVKYWVNVMLGGTQLRARLVWKENGRKCEGPVTIIPERYY